MERPASALPITSPADYFSLMKRQTTKDNVIVEKDVVKITGSMADYISLSKIVQPTVINLCGKQLDSGKRCLVENVGGCPNTGCPKHYGWQDEVEGFRLRTF